MNVKALSSDELHDLQGGVYHPIFPCEYPGPTPTWPIDPTGPILPVKPIFDPVIGPVITWQNG